MCSETSVINLQAVVIFSGNVLICRYLLVVAHCSCMTTPFAGWCLKEEEEGQDSGPCWYWLWLWWEWPLHWQLWGCKFLSSRIRFLRQLKWSTGGVSSLRVGGCGFDPRPCQTKDFKDGPHCVPAWHSRLALWCYTCSRRGWWFRCGRQITHSSGFDNHWDFTFKVFEVTFKVLFPYSWTIKCQTILKRCVILILLLLLLFTCILCIFCAH